MLLVLVASGIFEGTTIVLLVIVMSTVDLLDLYCIPMIYYKELRFTVLKAIA